MLHLLLGFPLLKKHATARYCASLTASDGKEDVHPADIEQKSLQADLPPLDLPSLTRQASDPSQHPADVLPPIGQPSLRRALSTNTPQKDMPQKTQANGECDAFWDVSPC